MRAFWVALGFLTVFPVGRPRDLTPADLGRAVGWFPAVGALVGALLVGLGWVGRRALPAELAALPVLIGWIGITGALHLDGFLDACDGIFGGRDPETRLRIMRDERIGAFALAGGVLLLLTKYAAIQALLRWPDVWTWVVLPPVLGRLAMSAAVVAFPYGRPEGTGRAMKDHATWRDVGLALGSALLVAGGIARLKGVGLVVATLLFALGAGTWVRRRLPTGLTGDIYGALCETTEALALVLLTVLHR